MGDNPLKQLFQQEFSRMVAVISRHFGLADIALAEDIVSETFMLASENWESKGIPPNPPAWLYTVAKQKAIHYFRRQKIYEKLLPELTASQAESYEPPELDFSEQNIRDSQLQMLFAVCNPVIASEAQIGLALRILCGFGIDEISEAFLTKKETINKRLFRAREKLRTEKISLELPGPAEISSRLDNVLHIIYLLFNEGYYSKTQNRILQQELCFEALRLGLLLTEYELTDLPKTNALIALMCFHASRFNARDNGEGSPILYEEQDDRLWNQELIERGCFFLNRAASGPQLSSYHLEAGIAYWHCRKADSPEKWEAILQLYNQLLMINYSPAVALNRTFALYKANGRKAALQEAEKLKLENNHFYFILLGELYTAIDRDKARVNFQKALKLTRNPVEQELIGKKIKALL